MNTWMSIPGQELPAVLTDRRSMLTVGDDIQVVYYRQQQPTDKSALTVHQNILSFVVHGHKQVYHRSGKLSVEPGEGFFLSKGNYLATERQPEDGYGYASLIFFLSDAALGGEVVGAPPAVFHFLRDDLLVSLIEQVRGYFVRMEERERIEALLPVKVKELLVLLTTGVSGNRDFKAMLEGLSARRKDGLEALMEAHFKEQLSLEQWAFLAGMSLSSFKRKFERVYGMPPRKWIQGRRLQEADRMLGIADPEEMNVAEVGYACGFENPAHFVQAFKDEFGVTPGKRRMGEKLLPG